MEIFNQLMEFSEKKNKQDNSFSYSNVLYLAIMRNSVYDVGQIFHFMPENVENSIAWSLLETARCHFLCIVEYANFNITRRSRGNLAFCIWKIWNAKIFDA